MIDRNQEIRFENVNGEHAAATVKEMIKRLDTAVAFISHSAESLETDADWWCIDGSKGASVMHLLDEAANMVCDAGLFLEAAFPKEVPQ